MLLTPLLQSLIATDEINETGDLAHTPDFWHALEGTFTVNYGAMTMVEQATWKAFNTLFGCEWWRIFTTHTNQTMSCVTVTGLRSIEATLTITDRVIKTTMTLVPVVTLMDAPSYGCTTDLDYHEYCVEMVLNGRSTRCLLPLTIIPSFDHPCDQQTRVRTSRWVCWIKEIMMTLGINVGLIPEELQYQAHAQVIRYHLELQRYTMNRWYEAVREALENESPIDLVEPMIDAVYFNHVALKDHTRIIARGCNDVILRYTPHTNGDTSNNRDWLIRFAGVLHNQHDQFLEISRLSTGECYSWPAFDLNYADHLIAGLLAIGIL